MIKSIIKKFILVINLLFIMDLACCAHTTDSVLQNCMKTGNYTTAAMIQCTYKRGDDFKELGKKQTADLKKQLSPTDYKKLLRNQQLFNIYAQTLEKGAINILYSTTGSIYPTMASGIYYETCYTNVKILTMLSGKEIYKETLLNKIPMPEKLMQQKLLILKNNLTPTEEKITGNHSSVYIYEKNYNRYQDVEKSQKAWLEYFNDTKNNIIPMFKSDSQIQNYIIRLLYENRIATLDTINAPFKE